MKRKSLLFLLLFALIAPWAANAQETLTVYDVGTTTNNYVPIYGLYCDEGVKCEFVIPAEQLTEMTNGTISAMKFYLASVGSSTIEPSFTIFVKEVDFTTMTAYTGTTDATTVFNSTFTFTSGATNVEIEVPFSENYTYEGGNLLIGVYQNGTSGYSSLSWTGVSQDYNSAWRGYGSSTGSAQQFLPKTTFTYTAGASDCDMPASIAARNITADGATVTWEGDGDKWNLRYKASTDADFTIVENLTTASYTLSSLQGNTTYSVGVQTVCTGSTSAFKSTSFTTENPCAAPTNFVASNITESSATLSWTAGYQETAWTVKYKKSSESSWDNATTVSVSGTPTTSLTGLDGLTLYNVRVYNCTGETDPYLSGNFTTAASFPYLQDFSGSTSIPTGWSQYSGLLADVMAGTETLASSTYGWSNGTSNGVLNGNHLYSNIYGTGCKKWIVTPAIPVESGARLTFDVAYTAFSGTAANPQTTGTDDKFVVLASTDNMATWTILRQWDNAGSEYVLNELTPATTNLVFDMADYAGQNVIVAFYAESTVSNADNNIHVDNVAFELVPACEKPTELAVIPNSVTAHSAQLSWTSDATAWIVAYKTAADTDFTEVNVSENPYTLTGLAENTTYTAKVCAVCDGTPSEWSISTVSFTTPIACPAPTNLAYSGITGSQATLNWSGTSDSYDVLYRMSAYADGVYENFGTSIPSGWQMYTGLLTNGTATMTSATYGWSFGTGNGVFDNHARVNIYGNNQRWLVTPTFTVLQDASTLSFDIALTAFSGNDVPAPATTGTDDKFIVLISTDNMSTWITLREWNNSGSEYVYNNIANTATGENVVIDLSGYVGQSVRIAFYGESTESNADNNLHIDNVYCGILHEAGEWQTAATGVTDNTYTLTGLSPETSYDVKVLSNCEGETGHEATISFTTEAACMAPIELTVVSTTTTTAVLTWTSDANAWQIQVNEEDPIDVTAIPYTLEGLNPATPYTFKVRANCDDAYSEWSQTKSFNTECDVVTTFPWNENFNSLTAGIPLCWDNSEGTTTALNYMWNYFATGHEGAGLRFNSYNNTNGYTNFLKTPVMNLPAGTTMQLSFWYKNPTGGDFSVFISTDGGTTYTNALAEGLTGQAEWTEKTIVLTDYVGAENVVIVFRGTSNYGNGDAYIYLDDVTVMEVPTCIAPTGLTVSNVTGHTAELSWTSDATAWQICLNGDETNLIDVTTNPYTLTGLTAETDYTVKVRANCGAEDGVSEWTTDVRITTTVACPAPTALTASNITPTGATISWQGSAESYNLRYGRPGAPDPTAPATIILTAHDVWGDGSGYQMLLDADATAYGDVFTADGGWTATSYEAFEYTIPEGAECSTDATHIVVDGSVSIQIPAGTYDWCITNPTPGDKIYIASSGGNVGGRQDDYVFEAGMTYEFVVRMDDNNQYDQTDVTIYSASDVVWTDMTNVTSPVTLENLDPETLYLIQVQAVCGGEDGVSEWTASSFTTLSACAAPNNLSAEATATGATLNWTGYQDSFNVRYRTSYDADILLYEDFSNGIGDWTTSNLNSSSGVNDNGYFMFYYTTEPPQYLISPLLDENGVTSGTHLLFYSCMYNANYPETFKVGFSSTDNAVESFTWSEEYTETSVQQFHANQFDVPEGTKYFAIQCTSNDMYVFFVTDFYVYNNVVEAGEWVVINGVTSPYNLTGLNPETGYDWEVQGINASCDGGVTDWTDYEYFTTLEQTTQTQTVALSAGTNWFSSNVEITLADLQNALTDVLGTNASITISSQTQSCTIKRNKWTGTLETIDLSQMYMIEVATACEISLEGSPINPTDHPVTISFGENWIAFPLNVTMSLNDAFAGFAQNDDAISSQTANASVKRNKWTGTMSDLQPGQGYIYTSAVSGSRTHVFPTASTKTAQTSVKPSGASLSVAKKQVAKTVNFDAKRVNGKPGIAKSIRK